MLVVFTILPSSMAFSTIHSTKQNRLVQTRLFEATDTNDSSNINYEDEDPRSNLTDEELLLACRSYLQKKNRLGEWAEFEKRKERRKRQQQLAQGSTTGGFFWDDPTELKYYRSPTLDNNKNDDNDSNDDEPKTNDEEDEDKELQTSESSSKNSMSSARLEQVAFEFQDDSDTSQLEQWSREFSSFPTEPSETRMKRHNAAIKRWEDPEWRDKWYESRWGSRKKGKSGKKESMSNRQTQASTAAVSYDFLNSEEFIGLSEEEVSEAIAIYTKANEKRAASRKKSLQERKAKLQGFDDNQPRVSLDALSWDRDPEALKEAKRRRSERARLTYQKRLENKAAAAADAEETTSKRGSRPCPRGFTPRDAMIRIEADLDKGKVPQLSDLGLIVAPTRLPKRKDLLRRILLECFGLRGKCVPSKKGNEEKLQFVTACSVEDLMSFVVSKVKEAEAKSDTKDDGLDWNLH